MSPDLDAGRGPWGVLELVLELNDAALFAADETNYARRVCSSMSHHRLVRSQRGYTTKHPSRYNLLAVERSAESRWHHGVVLPQARAQAARLAKARATAAAWLAQHQRQVEAQRLADQAAAAQAQAQAAHRRHLDDQLRDAARRARRHGARLLPAAPPGWLQAARPVVTVTPQLLQAEPWRAKLLNYRGGTIKL
jgi:hypothetical protein